MDAFSESMGLMNAAIVREALPRPLTDAQRAARYKETLAGYELDLEQIHRLATLALKLNTLATMTEALEKIQEVSQI